MSWDAPGSESTDSTRHVPKTRRTSTRIQPTAPEMPNPTKSWHPTRPESNTTLPVPERPAVARVAALASILPMTCPALPAPGSSPGVAKPVAVAALAAVGSQLPAPFAKSKSASRSWQGLLLRSVDTNCWHHCKTLPGQALTVYGVTDPQAAVCPGHGWIRKFISGCTVGQRIQQ